MRAKVLTLRFSAPLGRFDDAALVSLQQKVVLESVREHLVQVGCEAMLLCVATWREREVAAEERPAPDPTRANDAEATSNGPTSRPATPVGELCADFTSGEQALFDLVRQWRRQKAHDEGVPPYVVLTNRQLVEVVRQRPCDKTALGRIHGLGDKKIARHGEELLAILWPEASTTDNDSADAANEDPVQAAS